MKRSVFTVACWLGATAVSAQSAPAASSARQAEVGRPLIRNYTPREYGASAQNWAIIQDRRGVIYVGNSSGILEYDGTNWRKIDTPNKAVVRSFAIDDRGRIYVGSLKDFGYLAPGPTGAMHYVSLVDSVPADQREFGDVWRTFVAGDAVYFQSQSRLFRWSGGQIRVWTSKERFHRATLVDGQLYIGETGVGLMKLVGETLETLPGTQRFENEVYPVILPYDDKQILIGTRADGLFLYDGKTARPFATDIDPFLRASNPYRGTMLPDGTFALGTIGGGLVILDRQGHRHEMVDTSAGLRSNSVYYVFRDRQGALWLGLEGGIARVEIPSPISLYPESAVGSSGLSDLRRHHGTLYISSNRGVSYLQPPSSAEGGLNGVWPNFKPVADVENQCWSLLEFADPIAKEASQLLVACSDGVYRIEGVKATAIRRSVGSSFQAAFVLQSKRDPRRVWVALFDGLASLYWANGQWEDEGRIKGISDEIRSLYEAQDGTLWAGTSATGVLRLTFPAIPAAGGSRRPEASIDRFGTAQGLPSGGIAVVPAGGQPLFAGNEFAAFRFNLSTKTFTRDPVFDKVVSVSPLGLGSGVTEDAHGNVYVNYGRETAYAVRQPDGSYSFDKTRFLRLADFAIGVIYPEDDGVVWLGAGLPLVRYDGSRRTEHASDFTTLIRRVGLSDGSALAADVEEVAPEAGPKLSSATKALRFEFAAPTFDNEAATQFQSFLEGLDATWSDWSPDPRRDYTNLGLGSYRFHVRARNLYQQQGREAVFSFTILPPWYRTWWAYSAYALLLGVAFFAVDRVQRRRLTSKERERAQFREAQLRADSAEALAKSESERNRNIELLSQIGREITASLDFDTIFFKLYEHVNQLADADVFGVGLYHADTHQIEYRLAVENGKRYAPYSRDTTDKNQLPVWCIEHRQPVFINDVTTEYSRYLNQFTEPPRVLEDGSLSAEPQSLIYLPLVKQDRVLGVITIQSFKKNVYTEYHLSLLQSLAAYITIALDNAAAYRHLNEQEHEIRRLFEEAKDARAAAEQADAAKSSFLSTVSHELRTPLTSVLGFAKIIRKRLDERIFPLIQTDDRRTLQTIQQVDDNLKVVVSEGERLTKLIDDVLDLAKIEAGKLEWHMEPVGISEVIDRATAATASLFEHKGLALVKDVAPDLPTIVGDRDRLIQVVINLISNAVKFTDRGSVTCRASRQNGEIMVSIVDSGVGIAAEDQPKVFEKFKQVGDTLTDKPKGTGLGLPICREIVEHHGGRIWVESEPGKGSTFSFVLPTTSEAAQTAPLDLASLVRQLRQQVLVTTSRTDERHPTLLVVDDDEHIRELLKQEFTEAGYQVRLAANGREALAEIRRERPDLVILDVMMPEMNGFDVAAVLKNDPQTLDIPIIILSIVHDKERGFRLGVDRYLTKPIDTTVLFKEVGDLLQQGRSHRRVLIVDEDASTIKTLSDVLQARGYSVAEAGGANLIEKAIAVKPDIIIVNSLLSTKQDIVGSLRFEKGLENVVFFVYQ